MSSIPLHGYCSECASCAALSSLFNRLSAVGGAGEVDCCNVSYLSAAMNQTSLTLHTEC